jgi:hypothetical protein
VTQPLLLEQLHEFGIEISAGQLSHLLTQEQELFHQEKAQVLEAGLQVSHYLQTDDTGARHDGKNGYCTYIGNEFFAWFESTQSKSRVNFLSLLRAGHQDYVLNAGALAYMAHHKLPQGPSSTFCKRGEASRTSRPGRNTARVWASALPATG